LRSATAGQTRDSDLCTVNTLPATRYRIVPLDPRSHLFEVRCSVAEA